ncbi:Glycosyltransferase [Candidatus Rhodobacter oscarellae]|uniref:Glycosyltransferase n=1 Tax=Candidatus Rhodobacter oscarellae TaxID=1675527 RepID=A0A0J9EAC0_9RHOB|nr:glycosyltransferase family 2 protein [Candidatus Rhodobacter lobularis]KMW59730.1 Glycosyltransferase [Candidatus Rhodobacter lobularis]
MNSVGLSAVVPCYNEEASLPELYRRLTDACRLAMGDNYEIVLVDDGSMDATWGMIHSLSIEDDHIVAVKLARNHGHQIALSSGLEICRGDRILVIDADLQDPPELLQPMLKVMEDGADVVYGQRTERKGDIWFKRITAAAFYRLLDRLVETDIPKDTGDFRLMNRKVLSVLLDMPERHRYIRGMVAWAGFNQVAFPYARDERFAGETKYPLKRMLSLSADAITGFSVRPLKLASYLGFIFGAIAAMMIFYTIGQWLFFETVSGWTSLITVVLVLSSVQLLVLGVIGEYLGRLFIESKQRPMFIIDRVVVGGVESSYSARIEDRDAAKSDPLTKRAAE